MSAPLLTSGSGCRVDVDPIDLISRRRHRDRSCRRRHRQRRRRHRGLNGRRRHRRRRRCRGRSCRRRRRRRDVAGAGVVHPGSTGATRIVGMLGFVARATDVFHRVDRRRRVGDAGVRDAVVRERCCRARCFVRVVDVSGTLLSGWRRSRWRCVAGRVAGTVTTMVVVLGSAARHSGSLACSASSQLPRTSPGTPLSSGVPSPPRAAANAGTPSPSTDTPAMIQISRRFMMSPCCDCRRGGADSWLPTSSNPNGRTVHYWTYVLGPPAPAPAPASDT